MSLCDFTELIKAKIAVCYIVPLTAICRSAVFILTRIDLLGLWDSAALLLDSLLARFVYLLGFGYDYKVHKAGCVLITEACGRIARHAAVELVSEGYIVRNIVPKIRFLLE